ncbi:ead/Ea22-like family protein [Escherichia coli]|uniref:ead/Ea22-like family protein n=1 Tax=Escherichia coli TaxID=562 RepID=UPI0015D882D1|nr:ead/Ea22-like family protein [Escherichia coli]NZB04005.1 ead/Ea22-like family protein [Escherichia coli]NZB42434.1 ead/Ea22-like family protein [Escherichia coli]NZB47220.1 ead/Ea22-like family protein [Escherichia coli]NZB73595.1 ead/Ea22-like family protein [Escherichia coli]
MNKIDYQALREAAEKAGEDKWQAKKINGDFFVIRHGSYTRQHGYTSYQPIAEIDCKPVRDFVAKANPATVLALLDERERNQQYIKRRDQENEDIALTVGRLRVELEETKSKLNEQREYYEGVISDGSKRIAELEAREIKPAKGEVLVVVSGFTGCGKSAIAGEIEIAMKAIGVPVQWTNGDAEKRMTGADWLTAIEMYKPTVRIVEVNVPRVAGICIKGDAGEQNDEKP